MVNGSEAEQHRAIAVVGPTASGKTALALQLAGRFQGEIVSCDALQVYRQMDIGTAKPSPRERSAVRHHMLDLRDPCQDFSAGDYQRLARKALLDVRARRKTPIVVGGTGFYLKALIDGLFEGPGRDSSLRDRMRRIVQRRGSLCLHRALARVDPVSAARIAARDTSRIIRSYEVFLTTGQPMSRWQRRQRNHLRNFRWLKLGIAWDRDVLYGRIERRVLEMIETGFVEEVAALLGRFPKGCHAFKAIGYRQIADYLDGAVSLDEAVADTQRQSRRYAKRQLTWFRAMDDILWLDGAEGEEMVLARAVESVADYLGSG